MTKFIVLDIVCRTIFHFVFMLVSKVHERFKVNRRNLKNKSKDFEAGRSFE